MFDLPYIASLLFVIMFGFAVGSFMNVLIYRLPRRESIMFPGSRCPSCGTPLHFFDNIPVVSYIFLRGRCRYCGASISIQYPLVEIVTAVMITAVFLMRGWTLFFVADTMLIVILVAATFIDFKYMIIPNMLSYPAIILGIVMTARWQNGLLRGFHGAIIGVLILSFMYWLGRLLYRRESVGLGDFKLAAAIGFFLGPFWCATALVIAILIGGLGGMILMATGRAKRFSEIPFGPFISAGALATIFFRPQILFLVEKYLSIL